MSMMTKRSGKKHIKYRILGVIITTIVSLCGIFYTVYELSSGMWMYNSGMILAGFVSLLSVGFIVFVLEWDDIVESS